jgi:pyruvate carboxylase
LRIEGIATNIPFHQVTLADEEFNSGWYTTDFIEKQQILKKVREQVKKT